MSQQVSREEWDRWAKEASRQYAYGARSSAIEQLSGFSPSEWKMGFGKIFKGLKKLVKVAAPVASSFIPGVGGIVSKALARYGTGAGKIASIVTSAGSGALARAAAGRTPGFSGTVRETVRRATAAGRRVLPGVGRVAATSAVAGAAAGAGYRATGGGRTYVENPWGSGYRKGRKRRTSKSKRRVGKRPAPFGPARPRGKKAKRSGPRKWSAKQLANQRRFAQMARQRRARR